MRDEKTYAAVCAAMCGISAGQLAACIVRLYDMAAAGDIHRHPRVFPFCIITGGLSLVLLAAFVTAGIIIGAKIRKNAAETCADPKKEVLRKNILWAVIFIAALGISFEFMLFFIVFTEWFFI